MRDSFQTLWDLLKDAVAPAPKEPPPSSAARPFEPVRRPNHKRRPRAVVEAKPASARTQSTPKAKAATMAQRYDEITREMLELHNVRVRRWRNSMSGIAWQIRYRDGRVSRLIESPRPRGPMSAAVFLHEIGHHAIGFNVYKPRCLEEYHAWAFSLQQMEALGLNVTDSVRKRMHLSLRYAVHKAQRRGIKQLPPELLPFTRPWRVPATTLTRATPSVPRTPRPAPLRQRG